MVGAIVEGKEIDDDGLMDIYSTVGKDMTNEQMEAKGLVLLVILPAFQPSSHLGVGAIGGGRCGGNLMNRC